MTQQNTWTVGVITCPQRQNNLLRHTLDSLENAGFHIDHVFCDDGLGVHPHTHRSLLTLYYRNRFADRFCLFQDDILAVRNLAPYLDACPYPDNGWWNLSSHNQNEHIARKHDAKGWYPTHRHGIGAMGLVFDNRTLRALLSAPGLLDYALDTNQGRRFPNYVDKAIALTLIDMGFTEYYHSPALLQHTGIQSSIRSKTWPQQLSSSFPGEDFDALSLLET